MGKLNTVPSAAESKELEKLSKAGHVHFILLVVLICVAGLTLIFPDDVAPLAVIVLGALICLTGLSTVNLQYFQRCPRCTKRMSRAQRACAFCGLQYYAGEPSKQ